MAIYATAMRLLNQLVKERSPHLIEEIERNRGAIPEEKFLRGTGWKFQGNAAA